MGCSGAGSAMGPGSESSNSSRPRADADGLTTWDVSVDSTIARAHQHAAGARKGGLSNENRPAASTPNRPTTDSDAFEAE